MIGVPAAWAPVLEKHRVGAISPQLALAQLLLADASAQPELLLPALSGRDPGNAALARLSALACAHAPGMQSLRELIAAGLDPGGSVDDARAMFDKLAKTAPEAGVALYSLGDPELLAKATAELVAVIERWIPIAGRDLLDFGCGIGRLATALASCAGEVIGVDLSAGMIGEARRRAAGQQGVRFLQIAGPGLPELASGSVDAVVAADSLPYLVQVGETLVREQLAEFARVLRPGGDLLVFNWSYRGAPEADASDAHRLGVQAGFSLLRAGERPFRIWDASGFHLRKAG